MFEWISCRYMTKEEFQKNKGSTTHNALMYIVRGSFLYEMAGKTEKAGAEDFVCFPAGVYFERRIKKTAEFYHVVFETTQNEPLPVGKINVRDRTRLLSTLNYMCNLHVRPEENTELKNYFLNDIFMQLKIGELMDSCENDDVVKKASVFFEDNLGRKISLNDAAEFAGVSVSGLIGHFKKTLGITPVKFLNTTRIKKAEALLCHTNKPISQVAEESGFDNAYYFCNTFKKYNHISPSNYRKKYGV